MHPLLIDVVACLAYGVVGIALMALGYLIVDLLTPGKLHELIWTNRNRNATLIVASNTLGVAIVVSTAIAASANDLAAGLVTTVVYGLVGLLLMALSFLLIDLLTPGKLGSIVAENELHPAAWVNASAHLAVAAVVATAITDGRHHTGATSRAEGTPAPAPADRRFVVLFAVFVCAACGLVYELALVALGSYLIGDTVTQASRARRHGLRDGRRRPGRQAVAATGPRSRSRWSKAARAARRPVGPRPLRGVRLARPVRPALVSVAFLLGAADRRGDPAADVAAAAHPRQEAGSAVADLFAADYVGALIGGLAFPFLLLPVFGQLGGALLVGVVNAVTGMAVVWVFRRDLSRRAAGRAAPAPSWSPSCLAVRLGDRRRSR